MKRIFLFLILISPFCFAEGPKYKHEDSFVQQEMENVYQDLRRTILRLQGIKSTSNSDSITIATDGSVTIDSGNLTVSKSNSGSTNAIQVSNTSNTASSDAVLRATVAGSSAGDPFVRYDVTGVTSWISGIDNSDSDKFKISNNATPGTNDYFVITTGGQLQMPNGSEASPASSFINGTGYGMWYNGGNDLNFSTNGSISLSVQTGLIQCYRTIRPSADNTLSLGVSGGRWTEVWAANGTIQTSHSSTKSNIKDINPSIVDVPRGVFYERDGRKWIGYLNDNLPDEGRPVGDSLSNYEQSVIGILCAHVRKLEEEIAILKGAK